MMAFSPRAATSRVESGEKSTARMGGPSLSSKTCLYVRVSQMNACLNVPAAIHLPSVETARHSTSLTPSVSICLPSCTRHTCTPSGPPATRQSPFAVNAIASVLQPPSTVMGGGRSFQSSAPMQFYPVGTHHSSPTTWTLIMGVLNE